MARGLNATVVRATPLLAGLAILLSASLTSAANPPQVRIEAGIIAVSTRDGLAQIWSFHIDGSGGRALTKGPAAHYSPKVSPDGTRIAYTGEDGGGYSIYAMNIDGSGVVRLTRPPMSAGTPGWSPEGSLIAFSGSTSVVSGYQIWTMKPDGSGQKQLTHLSGSNGSPAFAPDGTRIAFANSRLGANGQSGSRIWTMNVDGSNAAAVTAGPDDGYVSWIDATWFLFARSSPDGTKSQVFLKTLGGGETPESPASGFYTEPQAGADGTKYITTGTGPGGGLALFWRPLNGDTTQAASIPIPITVGGDTYTPALIFEAAPSAPTPSGGGVAPSVPASPVAAAPSGVVSIASPPSSNGGLSLNGWEILIGVGIVAVAAGGVTYYVKPRPRKKRLNKACIEDCAWCRLAR
ncbi:MAG: PD40 domain-containing protein, partial [Chloroflexi bacterium]|nr:PD40 domain-containing protein [Chloroflexota bacterium]